MPWRPCGLLLVLYVCHLVFLAMSSCPPGCCCPRPGLLVMCESLGLRSLPRSVPLSISALSVARNQLCDVDHVFRPYLSLQELSLSHNQLARFPRGLPVSLEFLQLQENRITYITLGALRELGNLTRLDLEHNRIRAIQPGALQGNVKLQILTLKGNKLTHLPANLPPSLTHLDLSSNCISALDLPSLSALVNLQVLKINSNCLRSVPETAFDSLLRLRSVDLANNLWACECDILYLYRWLLGGRLKMATDLVCSEPVHLAHRLLLSLSVMVICPQVMSQNDIHRQEVSSAWEQRLEMSSVKPTAPGDQKSLEVKSLPVITAGYTSETQNTPDVPMKTRLLFQHFSLETLSFEECLSLTETSSLPHVESTSSQEDAVCRDTTGRDPQSVTTPSEGTRTGPGSLHSTNRDVPLPTLRPRFPPQHSTAVVSLLAVLCVLVTVLILSVLLVLKKVLLHQQRVAPLQQS